MDNEWFSIEKDGLPETGEEVLAYMLWGHKMRKEIVVLCDRNGPDGYQEWSGIFGVHRVPNQKYPENLHWSVGGHPADFIRVKYWMPLPEDP